MRGKRTESSLKGMRECVNGMNETISQMTYFSFFKEWMSSLFRSQCFYFKWKLCMSQTRNMHTSVYTSDHNISIKKKISCENSIVTIHVLILFCNVFKTFFVLMDAINILTDVIHSGRCLHELLQAIITHKI